MIVELSRTFSEFNEEGWRPYIHAVENLLYAHANGYHIFLPPRDTLLKLRSYLLFGERSKITLKNIEDKYAEYAGLARTVEFTVLAFPENCGPLVREENNQDKRVQLRFFDSAEASSPFFVLVENAYLGYFLRGLGDHNFRETPKP